MEYKINEQQPDGFNVDVTDIVLDTYEDVIKLMKSIDKVVYKRE